MQSLNDYERQTENTKQMAITAEKLSGQHNGSNDDIKVYNRGSDCPCCKDSQSMFWFDHNNTGFCMMCRQSFILVAKPEVEQQKIFNPKIFETNAFNWKKEK